MSEKRCLYVALIVASMVAICCVSAFAADKPYGYPDDLSMVPPEFSNYNYIIVSSSFAQVWSSDVSSAFVYDGGAMYFAPASMSASYLGYSNYSGGSWSSFTPYSGSNSYSKMIEGSLLYANFDVYDRNGNLVYSPPVPPPPDPYKNFWSDLKEVGTGVLGWAGNVASTITAEPVLLFTVGIFILGAAIGIFRRLLVRG